jgi:hypothetical protein
MNTQEFILKLAENLGADAKSVVVLICLVAPCINWVFGITLITIVLKTVAGIVTRNSRAERIVQKLGGLAGVNGIVCLETEFDRVENYVDKLKALPKQ